MYQVIYVLLVSSFILITLYIVQNSYNTYESFDLLHHTGLRPSVNRHKRYMRKCMEQFNKTYIEPFKVSMRKRKLI